MWFYWNLLAPKTLLLKGKLLLSLFTKCQNENGCMILKGNYNRCIAFLMVLRWPNMIFMFLVQQVCFALDLALVSSRSTHHQIYLVFFRESNISSLFIGLICSMYKMFATCMQNLGIMFVFLGRANTVLVTSVVDQPTRVFWTQVSTNKIWYKTVLPSWKIMNISELFGPKQLCGKRHTQIFWSS